MKVLLVDQITTINWKYTFSLANALKDNGIDVKVVTDCTCPQDYCRCDCVSLFTTDQKGISKISKLNNYISSYKKIIEIIRTEKYDVVHFEWVTFSPIDYYFLRKIKKYCKIVMTIHDIIAFDSHVYDKFYYKRVYSIPDALIIQTEDNINKFKNLFPKIPDDKINLAYHGHYLDFAHLINQKLAREKLGLPQDAFIFLFFGQIKKVKGVDLLIKAFAEVHKEHPETYLLIAGKVWHNDFAPYKQLIEDNNLNDAVRTDIRFIPDEDVDFYFSSCDIVCLPYTELYQSGVIQLSYAYGKPAIVSDLPAFLTVVEDNINGYVFESTNTKSLSEKMFVAFDTKEQLCKQGKVGQDEIREKFSWDLIAKKLVSIYSVLL